MNNCAFRWLGRVRIFIVYGRTVYKIDSSDSFETRQSALALKEGMGYEYLIPKESDKTKL